jgi:phosphate transport system permease protein
MNSPAENAALLNAGLKKRYRAEARFQWYGRLAVVFGLLIVFVLFADIFRNGYQAFVTTQIRLDVSFDPQTIGVEPEADAEELQNVRLDSVIREAVFARFPEVTGRSERRDLLGLVSWGASFDLADKLAENPQWLGTTQQVWLSVDDEVDMYRKGHIDLQRPEAERPISDLEAGWIEQLMQDGDLRGRFNTGFFTSGDSREPEQAGILGAAVGSMWTLLVTLLLSFPIGIAAALYLEEFAPRNRLTQIIEVNINNLAAVPSIIFGLLGLAIFINFFGLPRSAPLVGGLVLTLMTLPTIIISSRAAIKAVPPSIREAALGVGASQTQTVMHHVLPLAMPGMLTGSIIGMAQALGETAPLLMIGMVAFIVDVPESITDAATVLPVQIYLWADSPERAFVEKTSGAILVLLAFLISMNAAAVFLRKRLERRW